MNQLTFTNIEEDVLASVLRRQRELCASLASAIETGELTAREIRSRVGQIESGLKRIYRAA